MTSRLYGRARDKGSGLAAGVAWTLLARSSPPLYVQRFPDADEELRVVDGPRNILPLGSPPSGRRARPSPGAPLWIANAVSITRGRRPETSSDKTLSVMDLFTPDRPEWTVEAACLALGQSESTVYRYFRSLAAAGLIFSIRPGRYLLGPGIVHYDRQLRSSDPLLRAAEPTFARLSGAYEGPSTVFICRIYRDHVMAMHEHRSGAPALPEGVFARGRLAPLFCGPPALAMLASMEIRAVRALFQKSGGHDGDWLEIKRRMRTIRAAGYAVSIDDPDPGVILLAAPLKQQDGGIAGGLCFALAHTAENVALIAQAGQDLIDEAAEMSERSLRFSNA